VCIMAMRWMWFSCPSHASKSCCISCQCRHARMRRVMARCCSNRSWDAARVAAAAAASPSAVTSAMVSAV
jgi:hypothetical protein